MEKCGNAEFTFELIFSRLFLFRSTSKKRIFFDLFAWLSLFSLTLASTCSWALSITAVTPAAGQVGDSVVIAGDGFNPTLVDNAILFNGVPGQVTYANPSEIDVTVPAGATSGPISVVAYDQNATSPSDFTINPPATPPTITGFTPTNGIVGATVTINGTNFDPNSDNDYVGFQAADGWVLATVTSASQNQLVVTVPDGAIAGQISVQAGDPFCESSIAFTVTPPPAPVSILQVTPDSGPVGGQVLITGAGFSTTAANNVVQFNGVSATVVYAATGVIIATVPVGATSGPITTTVAGTTATSDSNFTVATATASSPTITSISPTFGPVDATVTISGSNFDATPGNNRVDFVGAAANDLSTATISSASSTQLVVAVPFGAKSGLICVTVAGLLGCSADIFSVPVPTISSFGPINGEVGSTVTIEGTNFDSTPANNSVLFNGVSASVVSATATELTVRVPDATTGPISVAVNGGTPVASTTNFVYPPSVGDIWPTAGSVGTLVDISGTDFDPIPVNNIVTFNGVNAVVYSVGFGEIAVFVPEEATTGPISVSVNGLASTSTPEFTITQTPTITGFSPIGGRVGAEVTITGTNFDSNIQNEQITLDGVPVEIKSASLTQLVVTIPSQAQSAQFLLAVGSAPTIASATAFSVTDQKVPQVLYAAGYDGENSNVIVAVDTSSGGVISRIPVPSAGSFGVQGLVANPSGSKLFSVVDGAFYVIDTLTNSIDASLPSGDYCHPYYSSAWPISKIVTPCLIMSESGATVVAVGASTVTIIDATNYSTVNVLNLNYLISSYVYDSSSSRIFLQTWDNLYVIDLTTSSIQTIDWSYGDTGFMLLNKGAHLLYLGWATLDTNTLEQAPYFSVINEYTHNSDINTDITGKIVSFADENGGYYDFYYALSFDFSAEPFSSIPLFSSENVDVSILGARPSVDGLFIYALTSENNIANYFKVIGTDGQSIKSYPVSPGLSIGSSLIDPSGAFAYIPESGAGAGGSGTGLAPTPYLAVFDTSDNSIKRSNIFINGPLGFFMPGQYGHMLLVNTVPVDRANVVHMAGAYFPGGVGGSIPPSSCPTLYGNKPFPMVVRAANYSNAATVTAPTEVVLSPSPGTVGGLIGVTRCTIPVGEGECTISGIGFDTPQDAAGLVASVHVLSGAEGQFPPDAYYPNPIQAASPTCPVHPAPAPLITGIAPASGAAGDAVVITGMNLGSVGQNAPQVFFSGVSVPAQIVGSPMDTQITVIVPAGAQTGPITVSVAGQSGTSPLAFTVIGQPNAPLSVNASTSASDARIITLSWQPDTSGASATYFQVEEAVAPGNVWMMLLTNLPTSPTSTTITHAIQGTYSYGVAACNASGCSDYTLTSSPVTASGIPNPPASISVAPPSTGSNVVSVSWSPGNGGAPATYYQLEQKTSGGNWIAIQNNLPLSPTQSYVAPATSDSYQFGVAACNANGCSAFTTTTTATSVTVSGGTSGIPAIPPIPQLATSPTADPVSDAVGATTGQFAVDSGGNASYRIPIYTPRGAGGLTPGLAISYNSGGGEGALGVGWQLEGESAISICRKTQEHGDGLGVSELAYTQPTKAAYCLDGQRLILMSGDNGTTGATYRTENDLFARVTIQAASTTNGAPGSSYTVPTTWLVQNKDGSAHRYGGTDTDSNGLARAQLAWKRPADNAVFTKSWYRYEIKDTNGNAIHYNYANLATSHAAWVALSSITYSGGSITFANQSPGSSADCSFGQPISYQGGIPVQRQTMLGANAIQSESTVVYCGAGSTAGDIVVSSGGSVLRNYKLTYQHAVDNPIQLQLIGIQECDNSSPQICYAPTTFNWADASAWSAAAVNPGVSVLNGNHERSFWYQNPSGMRFGDVNGDGRADAVFLIDYGTHRHMGFRIGFSDPSAGSNSGGGFSSFFDEDTSFGNVASSNCHSDSDSGTPRNNYSCPQFYKFLDPAGSFQLLDFNGDGKDDLILLEATNGDYTDDPRPDQFRWVVWLSDGTKFATKISGISASPFSNFNNGAYRSVDNSASCATVPCDMPLAKAFNYDEHSHSGRMHIADLDGDGLPDAFVLNDQSASVWLLKPNTTGQQCQAKQRNASGVVNTVQVACPYLFQGPYNVVIDMPQGAAACPISDFTAQELRVADFNGDGRADILLKQDSACAAPNNPSASNEYLQIFTAVGIGSDGNYHFAPGYAWPTSFSDPNGYNHRELFQVVDINGDGLPDVAFSRGGDNDSSTDNSGGWVYQLNTGDGSFTSPACTVSDGNGGCALLSGPYEVQFGDYDGDGKADLIVPQFRCNGQDPSCANLLVYLWQDSVNGGQGGFSQQPVVTPFLSPDIGSSSKNLFSYLADMDGDGYPDQLMTDPTGNGHFNHGGWQITRSTSHHKPRHLVTTIQSGLGAITQLTYGPLTYSSLYYREYNGYALTSGYGAAVQDTFAPRWVVQYAESTAPTELDSAKPQTTGPDAMSTIRYRYAGQKIQGGGRGSLGFHKVYSTDEQTGVTTVTTYNQAYPFTGTPIETIAYQDSPNVDTVCDVSAGGNPDASACMKYGIQADGLAGKPVLSDSRDAFTAYWQDGSGTALAAASVGTTTGLPLTTPASPKPLFLARTGSAQLKYGLDNTLLSAQQSAFDYTGNNGIAYGELQSSTVTDYSTATSAFVFSSQIRETTTTQQYGQDDESKWFLGRLTQSTTTVIGGNEDGVNGDTISRTSSFEYDATTGQLIGEHLQQGAGDYQEVNKYHFYDSNGNETEVDTCSSTANCSATTKLSSTGVTFNSTDDRWVQRYARSDFSATSATGGVNGVYANATYAPFSNGEVKTLTVNSRDAFGTPIDTTDAHGVQVKTATNTLGRTYFSASNSGAATQTIYRWCDTDLNPYVAANVPSANQVPCPSNGVYRVQTDSSIGINDGSSRSPATWTYYDSLGRVVLKLQQGFDASQTIAVATAYDNLGRTTKTTEPYFTYDANSSKVGQSADATQTVDANCLDAPYCTSQTYDILGRVRLITHPNGALTTTTYTGLNAKVTSPANGSNQVETRQKTQNHLGQVVTITDANGSTVSNAYDPSGNVLSVTRSGTGMTSTTSSMTYDVLGRKTGLVDSDAGTWTYSYNALGEQIAKTGVSVCTTTRYDGQGRVAARNDYANGTCSGSAETTASWTYDGSAAQAGLIQTATGTDNGFTEIQAPSYDGFGRISSVATTLGAMHYTQRTTYDQYGRGFQGFFSGDGIAETGELTKYNAQGYPYQTRDGENGLLGTIYQEVSAMDARGHVTAELRADGHLSTNRSYDSAMGWLTKIASSQTLAASSSPAVIQNLVYQYDALGNVVLRKDQSPNTSTNEYACYDKLQRLTWQGNTGIATPPSGCPTSPVNPTALPNSLSNASAATNADARQALYPAPLMPASATALADGVGTQNSYDAFGNIISNGQFGYVYQSYTNSALCTGVGGVSSAGVDAVTQANGVTYCYDARGNQIASIDSAGNPQRTATYTTYDALRTASSNTSTHTTRWTYGIGRERAVREDADSAVSTTSASSVTHYLGNAEISLNPTTKSAAIQVKRYLGGLILTQTIGGSTGANYLFTDNLGSTHRITDANGNALSGSGSAQAYTAFGSRASASDGTYVALDFGSSVDFDTSATHHGYTGHEMLDEVGLIHMNGRVYDASLQRFVQADPFVQDAGNLQSLNRYSYVLNNPLATTDPTGYWGHRQQGYLRTAGAIAITVFTSGLASEYMALASSDFVGGSVALGAGEYATAASIVVAGGAAAGYVQTGNTKGAVLGGLEAGLDFGIGQTFNFGNDYTSATAFENYGAHAALGGVMSVLRGGKFGHGFITAGVGSVIDPHYDSNIVVGTVEAAVVGGTVSQLTGGKFTNGAMTAAFAFAFNQALSHDDSCDESCQLDKMVADQEAGHAKIVATGKALATTGKVAGEVMDTAALSLIPQSWFARAFGWIRSLWGVRALTNFSRDLRIADLGVKGTVDELRGTFALQDGVATIRVDMIRGKIENPLQVVNNMVEAARATGATSLRIEGTIANERLYNVLEARYDLTSNGATDSIIIPLKR